MTEPPYSPPKPNRLDAAHSGVQAALATIPVASELFVALVTPSLDRRRQKWMEEVGEALRRLEADKGIRLEELQDNETFIDIAMQASVAALRTSQEEKRQALRNTIVNAASPNAPEELLQQLFISLIDDFNVWHLRILKLFQSPRRWAKNHKHTFPKFRAGNLETVLLSAYPELRQNQEFYDQIWRELNTRGLVTTDSLHPVTSEATLMQSHITHLGNEFLRFIETP